MKLLTIFPFIARLLWNCGIWCLVSLEIIGLCQCLSLGYLLVGKVDLVAIIMEIYGWLFLIVWCGAFGRREIGVLKTLSVPCLTSSFFFSKLYWTSSLCGGIFLFLLFWIFLTFVMFVLDLFTPVYSPCTWVSLSFCYQWIFITYQKKCAPSSLWGSFWVGAIIFSSWALILVIICSPNFHVIGETFWFFFLTLAKSELRRSKEMSSLSSMTRFIIVSMAESTAGGWWDLIIFKKLWKSQQPMHHTQDPASPSITRPLQWYQELKPPCYKSE